MNNEAIDTDFTPISSETALAPLPKNQIVRSLDKKEVMEQRALAAEVYNDRFIPQVMRRAGPGGFVKFGDKVGIQAPGVRAIKGFFGFNSELMPGPDGRAMPWREPSNAKPDEEYCWNVVIRAWSTELNTFVSGIMGVAESHQDKKTASGFERVPNAYSLGGARIWTPRGDNSLKRAAFAHAETYAFKCCCGFDDIPAWLLEKVGWTIADIGSVTFRESEEKAPETTAKAPPRTAPKPAATSPTPTASAGDGKTKPPWTDGHEEIKTTLAQLSDDEANQKAILGELAARIYDGKLTKSSNLPWFTENGVSKVLPRIRQLMDMEIEQPSDSFDRMLERAHEINPVEAPDG